MTETGPSGPRYTPKLPSTRADYLKPLHIDVCDEHNNRGDRHQASTYADSTAPPLDGVPVLSCQHNGSRRRQSGREQGTLVQGTPVATRIAGF